MKKQVITYVDGSYSSKNPDIVGWGIVINGGPSYHGAISGEIVSMRQVAGELAATMHAIKWAIDNNYDKIIIRYDYEGVKHWAQGTWKAKNKWTKAYRDYMLDKSNVINIVFQKVSSNENPADAEARKATGAKNAHR